MAARDGLERHSDLQVRLPGAVVPNLVALESGDKSESPLHAATKRATQWVRLLGLGVGLGCWVRFLG